MLYVSMTTQTVKMYQMILAEVLTVVVPEFVATKALTKDVLYFQFR